MEFTLLGAAAIGAGCVYAVLWWEGGRTNAAECTRDVWDSLVTAAVVGMVVGRLVAMLRAGTNPLTHPADVLIVRGGVDTLAAAAAALGVLAWMLRADLRSLADAAAPAALAGLAGWHGACTVRSSCLGARSGLPWAIAQEPGGPTRHPVEIYAALGLVVAAVLLIWWKQHRRIPGLVAVVALASAAGIRAATEPFRLGIGTDLEWWYVSIAGAALVTAAGISWVAHHPSTPGSDRSLRTLRRR